MEKIFRTDLKSVGRRIREARLGLGMTQERAAEQAGITGQYWSLIETGRMRGSVNTYLQIVSSLGLTLNDIFYNDAETSRFCKALSLDGLLSDCTDFEKTVISETILSLKDVLLRARKL